MRLASIVVSVVALSSIVLVVGAATDDDPQLAKYMDWLGSVSASPPLIRVVATPTSPAGEYAVRAAVAYRIPRHVDMLRLPAEFVLCDATLGQRYSSEVVKTIKQLPLAIDRLAVTLIIEHARHALSPLEPWVRFVLSEVAPLSPLLRSTSDIELVEPKAVRDAITARREQLFDSFDTTVLRVLQSLEQLRNVTSSGERLHDVATKARYVAARAAAEMMAVDVPGKGLLIAPGLEFAERRVDRLLSRPAIRPDVSAAVRAPLSPKAPHAIRMTDTILSVVLSDVSPVNEQGEGGPLVDFILPHRTQEEEMFATWGMVPATSNSVDCQDMVFNHGLNTERNEVKGITSSSLERLLTHVACLHFNETPFEGLLGALVSELPAQLPRHVIDCIVALSDKSCAEAVYVAAEACLASGLDRRQWLRLRLRVSQSLQQALLSFIRQQFRHPIQAHLEAEEAAIAHELAIDPGQSRPARRALRWRLNALRLKHHRYDISMSVLGRVEARTKEAEQDLLLPHREDESDVAISDEL